MKEPVDSRADETLDLYDITTWEPRTALDRLAISTHRQVLRAGRWALVVLGIFILLLIIAGGIGAVVINNPFVIVLVVLSVVPAGILALYFYFTDVTASEPVTLLAGTFVLAVLFAGFAAVINTILGIIQLLPFIGLILFFYLVVGPVEETVKILAVRLYAFRDERFNSVVDGVVYGAVAGLGFATIENAVYISQDIQPPALAFANSLTVLPLPDPVSTNIEEAIVAGGEITAVRGMAGPGHVIYSAFAGYYLGLAKFNPENAGPIVVKGLLIAAFIHATYNTLVGIVPGIVLLLVPGVSLLVVFLGFVLIYDGLFLYILYRKLQRYRNVYTSVTGPHPSQSLPVQQTEFEPDTVDDKGNSGSQTPEHNPFR